MAKEQVKVRTFYQLHPCYLHFCNNYITKNPSKVVYCRQYFD